ncbi:hypothetical protein Bbelb_233320 [Branchiostoma belcheri]|nr:hypothetical protein Bbelb_233320 [Branchiostoma belcheri]
MSGISGNATVSTQGFPLQSTKEAQVSPPKKLPRPDNGSSLTEATPDVTLHPAPAAGLPRAETRAGLGATGASQPFPTKPPARLQPGECGRNSARGLAGKRLGAGTDIWRTPGENSSADFISISATQLESYLFCLPPPKNVSPSRIQRTSRIDNQSGNQAQNEHITNSVKLRPQTWQKCAEDLGSIWCLPPEF